MMLKQNIFIALLLTCCFLKSAESPTTVQVPMWVIIYDNTFGKHSYGVKLMTRDRIEKLRELYLWEGYGYSGLCETKLMVVGEFTKEDEDIILSLKDKEASEELQERILLEIEERKQQIRKEYERAGQWSSEKPIPQWQKQKYPKNDNRIDRSKHAQFTMRINQPKSKGKRRG